MGGLFISHPKTLLCDLLQKPHLVLSDTPFGQDLKLCCCKHHMQRPFFLTMFHFSSEVAFAKKTHVSIEWLFVCPFSLHHKHVSSVILPVWLLCPSWVRGMSGGILETLPKLAERGGGVLSVDSFIVVDVSNDLFPSVGYLAVELNGDLGALFHIVFGRLLLVF